MRIDAHHHFWQPGRFKYPWIGPATPALERDFGPGDLVPLLTEHRLDGSILVQTIHSLAETEWFLELAKAEERLLGVVGWTDLAAKELAASLDRLAAAGKLVGVRHNFQDDPDSAWLESEAVQQGLAVLADRELAFDLLLRPRHLAAAIETARRHPDLRLVVDHIAKPPIAARRGWSHDGGEWEAGIRELAHCPNVTCKLSGMITEADPRQWTCDDLKPYVDHVLACFHADRVMFGSDWPVCLLAGSYRQVIEALDSTLIGLSHAEQALVFGENAATFYRLETEPE